MYKPANYVPFCPPTNCIEEMVWPPYICEVRLRGEYETGLLARFVFPCSRWMHPPASGVYCGITVSAGEWTTITMFVSTATPTEFVMPSSKELLVRLHTTDAVGVEVCAFQS